MYMMGRRRSFIRSSPSMEHRRQAPGHTKPSEWSRHGRARGKGTSRPSEQFIRLSAIRVREGGGVTGTVLSTVV